MSDYATPVLAPQEGRHSDPSASLIVRAGVELYALPGACVREVTRWRAPTPVPGAPAVIPGIINQRGSILPVVDLRIALGLPAGAPERSTRFVVLHHETAALALLVDAVLDLALLDDATFEPPPAGQARLLGAVSRYEQHPLGVIDPAALVAAVQEGL
ncbi:MAG: chemotaxis protein CheW [Oscillochloridaceae bacterium]|nr:chemotaxis protein CheW [Chloroflexaceae bacterium]MDW8390009.1 chemotaxis protein CheW [Oscillochloridaceae bacterium]